MNTRTGFFFLVLSILLVPILMLAVVIPAVFQVERPAQFFPNAATDEQLKEFIETESLMKFSADNTEELLFIVINDGKITASNIENYNAGADIENSAFADFFIKTSSPDTVQITRHVPGVADLMIISLPVSITALMTQGRVIMRVLPATMLVAIITSATVFSLLILRSMNRKFRKLEKAAEEISSGNLDFSVDFSGNDYFSSFAATFNSMRIALKEEKDRENRFIMGISHDLKTPLTLIGGYTEALADELGSAEDRERYALIISRKLRDMERKIDTLIDYRRMETGEWKTSLEQLELKKLLQEYSLLLQEDTGFMNIAFSSDINIPDDYRPHIDSGLLLRLIENVVNNSIKFTTEGGRITMKAYMRDHTAVLEISDTGSGIDKAELSRVTEPFYRVSKSRREPGFGLGLSIVKSIAEAHGWKLDIKSEKDFGTSVIVAEI